LLEAVREVAQSIVKRFDRTYWLKCARESRPTSEMWQALGDSGLLGLRVPETYGGVGGGVTEMAALVETLATAGVPLSHIVLTGFSRVPIMNYGTPEQIERYVKPTTTGERKLCFAITVLLTLEGYGFCKPGEGGPFVAAGNLRLDGQIPANTAGGELSWSYMQGFTPVCEGIRQMRNESGSTQVPGAELCLVTGHGGVTKGIGYMEYAEASMILRRA